MQNRSSNQLLAGQIFSILRLAFLPIERDILGDCAQQTFERAFCAAENRFSAENIYLRYAPDGELAAIMCAYAGHRAVALDAALSEIVGFKIIPECEADEFYIDSVATAPKYRRCGHLREFLRLAKNLAAKEGLNKISLLTKNPEYYEQAGFCEVAHPKIAGEIYCKMIWQI